MGSRPTAHGPLPGLSGLRTGLPQRRALSRSDQPVPRAGRNPNSAVRPSTNSAACSPRKPFRFPRDSVSPRNGAALGKAVPPAAAARVAADAGFIAANHSARAKLARVTPARGERRARVALLAGCAQQVLDPDINTATIEVLARNGVEVIVPPAQGCCGGLAWHTGDLAAPRKPSPGAISPPSLPTWTRS